MARSQSRRQFIQTTTAAGLAAATYSLMPGRVLGANEKVNVACIGIGGRGGGLVKTLNQSDNCNIVALCDVDMGGSKTKGSMEMFPKVPHFQDFRVMFDKMGKDIDAVTVAVPDHAHFPITMLAMSLGKAVYVEKPLAHTFQECELLMAAEKKYGVACQMGNQGHSGNNYVQFKSWVEAGVIKDITKVTAYMNKGRRWHPWGNVTGYPNEPVPETMDWDIWLGTAPEHPFSERLHPGNWRSWYDYGNGAFGDWGPHTLDTIHRFLELGLPERVTAVKLEGPNKFIYPMGSTIQFDFPARGKMPPVEISWYDGVKNKPPRPEQLGEKQKIEACGKMMFGKDLAFKGGTHSSTLRIIPEEAMQDMAKDLPRITEKQSTHTENLILSAKGEEKTRSSFDISGPLTQVFMLGVIAQRLGGTLEFDRKTKQITNNKLANALLVGPPPRKGWEEYYKL